MVALKNWNRTKISPVHFPNRKLALVKDEGWLSGHSTAGRTSEPLLYSWCQPASVCESAEQQPKNGQTCSFSTAWALHFPGPAGGPNEYVIFRLYELQSKHRGFCHCNCRPFDRHVWFMWLLLKGRAIFGRTFGIADYVLHCAKKALLVTWC